MARRARRETESNDTPKINFDDTRRFELYMEQRRAYNDGARFAYQWFDQTIIALSAGGVVASMAIIKDIAFAPWTIFLLIPCWIAFVLAGACAFISMRTGGDADMENMNQIDCLVLSGKCDETKATRLTNLTNKLNRGEERFAAAGTILLLLFGTCNVAYKAIDEWRKSDRPQAVTSAPSQPEKHPSPRTSVSNPQAVPPPGSTSPGSPPSPSPHP